VSSHTGIVGSLGSAFLALVALWRKVADPLTKVVSVDPAKLLGSNDAVQQAQAVREFAKEFEQVAARLPRDTRLIVYVDDLDRCRPDRVVNILETISMLADTGCAFFVLAFDPAIVRRSVELIYKDMIEATRKEDPEEARRYGHRFLEKLITLGMTVPSVPAQTTEVDARVEARQQPSWLETMFTYLVPSRSWLLALVLAAVPVTITGYFIQNLGGVSAVIDRSASALSSPPPAPQTKPHPDADASQAQHGAAPAPADNSGNKVGSKGKQSEPKQRKPLAKAEPAVQPPALVTAPAHDSPAAARVFADLMRLLIGGFAALCTLALLGLLAADIVRRRRMRSAPKMGTDSEAFRNELTKAKKGLPDNPRGVVRFTNLSRFLYRVLSQKSELDDAGRTSDSVALQKSAGGADCIRDFFALLQARWLGCAEPVVVPWVKEEIDRWFAAAAVTPVAGKDDEAKRTQPPQHPIDARSDPL
jgi:hypothetical protein